MIQDLTNISKILYLKLFNTYKYTSCERDKTLPCRRAAQSLERQAQGQMPALNLLDGGAKYQPQVAASPAAEIGDSGSTTLLSPWYMLPTVCQRMEAAPGADTVTLD